MRTKSLLVLRERLLLALTLADDEADTIREGARNAVIREGVSNDVIREGVCNVDALREGVALSGVILAVASGWTAPGSS